MRRKTIEDYVELMYDIQKEKGIVHTNDIANAFDINPSSVTEILQKLSQEGYINYQKYAGVTLTSKGRKIAIQTRDKHKTLKDFLLLLGVDEKIAEKDACEMEHILNRETMKMIIKFVEVVKKCKITPYWLKRFKEYVETGQLSECPPELTKLILSYSKDSK